MNSEYSAYKRAIAYLESFQNISYKKDEQNPKKGLLRTQYLLNLLDDPQDKLKYVHITGTSGKGSVSYLVSRCLYKNNIKTGLFNSPFAVSTVEKIQVNGKYISAKEFVETADHLKSFLDKMAKECPYGVATYFEIVFVFAIVYFVKTKCLWAVLEVGLGGTYDATNIISSPKVSAITNVSLDHTEFLGRTLLKIATDKAGIIKKDSTFITSEERKSLIALFKKVCKQRKAKFIGLSIRGLSYNERNIKLAEAISKEIGLNDLNSLKEKMQMPCRFEIISKKPLIILDGAHNEAKIGSVLFNLDRLSYKNLTIILAVAEDKHVKAIIKMLAPKADRFYLTHFSLISRKSTRLSFMYRLLRKYALPNTKISIKTDQFEAFDEARKDLGNNDALLVTGSFFLAGEIRALFHPEEEIIKHRASFF